MAGKVGQLLLGRYDPYSGSHASGYVPVRGDIVFVPKGGGILSALVKEVIDPRHIRLLPLHERGEDTTTSDALIPRHKYRREETVAKEKPKKKNKDEEDEDDDEVEETSSEEEDEDESDEDEDEDEKPAKKKSKSKDEDEDEDESDEDEDEEETPKKKSKSKKSDDDDDDDDDEEDEDEDEKPAKKKKSKKSDDDDDDDEEDEDEVAAKKKSKKEEKPVKAKGKKQEDDDEDDEEEEEDEAPKKKGKKKGRGAPKGPRPVDLSKNPAREGTKRFFLIQAMRKGGTAADIIDRAKELHKEEHGKLSKDDSAKYDRIGKAGVTDVSEMLEERGYDVTRDEKKGTFKVSISGGKKSK